MTTDNERSIRGFLPSLCMALCATLALQVNAADDQTKNPPSRSDNAKKGAKDDGRAAPPTATKDGKAQQEVVAEPPRQTPGKVDISKDPKAAQASTEGQPTLLEESDSTANAKKERADKAAQKKKPQKPAADSGKSSTR